MSGELLVILIVALLVFKPKNLPLLASHLGKMLVKFHQLKQQVSQIWQEQIALQQLSENEEKAKRADEVYDRAD